jgi:hypothetical protein
MYNRSNGDPGSCFIRIIKSEILKIIFSLYMCASAFNVIIMDTSFVGRQNLSFGAIKLFVMNCIPKRTWKKLLK